MLDHPGYCDQHQQPSTAKDYNQFKRNKEADKFYHSARWKHCRTEFITTHPTCQRCQNKVAAAVHHVIPFTQCSHDQQTDPANLMALCQPCHNAIEAEEAPPPPTAIGTLEIVEDENFYFDQEAADAPIRFIQKYFKHYEGRFAGRPFTLLNWQKEKVIRPLFGWKHRSTKLRRFKELYLITAKGAGKTPLMTVIGLILLLADNEAAPHIVSMGASFEQAGLTFNAARMYIEESPLANHPQIDWNKFAITGPRHARWTIVSGKNKGRSGTRPNCILADELHEYDAQAVQNYLTVTANLFKRSQPLLINCTNAAKDRQHFAYQLHERAVQVLDGKSDDTSLLPVIFEAPKELDWRTEAAARAANPSIPDIVTFDQIKPEQTKGEARYRRLYLSQWVTGSDKWIDQDRWRACTRPIDPPADAPIYLGLDLSGGDDLCAAVEVYPTPSMYHVRPRFWLPRQTADRYEQKELIPYSQWSEDGDIRLLDQPTISTEVQAIIAGEIIELHKARPITAVCYDRAYSSGIIPTLEQAGIVCVPIGQGWEIWQGCEELTRRLIEGSICIEPNQVMDFCANNVEIEPGKHGTYSLIKPGQKSSKITGRRSQKIDGIQALCTALTHARKHDFPKPAPHVAAILMEL